MSGSVRFSVLVCLNRPTRTEPNRFSLEMKKKLNQAVLATCLVRRVLSLISLSTTRAYHFKFNFLLSFHTAALSSPTRFPVLDLRTFPLLPNPSPVKKNLVFLSLFTFLSCLIASTQPLETCLQPPSVILLCSKNLNKIFYLNENLTVLFMTCFIVVLLLLLTVLAF